MLGIKDVPDTRERIDLGDRLVRPQTNNSGEAQGETAVVAFRALNIVEGYFKDDGRLHVALIAAIFCGVLQKVLGKLANLDVAQARVGFANIDQPDVVAHGKGVIGEQAATLAMSVFGNGNDYIEGGQRSLELHPELAATPGDVG